MHMATRRFALAAALGLALSAGLAGAAPAQTFKFGVIGPLTGTGAVWGSAAAEAARILAAEVNARGGLDIAGRKHKVEVVAYDDQYKAADALAAYSRFVTRDGGQYLMTVGSAPTLALAPVVESDKTILITSAGVEKAVDPKSRNIFRILSILRDYVPQVVGWVKENRSERRVVILNPNDESGWASTEVAKAAYGKHGFQIVGADVYERTVKDFQPLLTRVLAQNPEIIELASSTPATSGLIVRQARELGYKGLFVKNSGAAVNEILETAGKAGAEGVISLHFADPNNEGYKRLAAEYRKTYNQQADDLVAVYYEAMNAVLQAVQKAGGFDDTAKVSDALFKEVFPLKSVQGGEVSLGGNGQAGDPNQIITWSFISVIKNGEPIIVGKVK
jgi:branched-chain amino acid transport system substrate-binding protein